MSKVALGTVQFGLDYGINNSSGEIKQSDVNALLSFAQEQQIHLLDTAMAYGNSHEKIGTALSAFPQLSFNIVSKLPSRFQLAAIEGLVTTARAVLQQEQLYGMLFHDFASFKSNTDALKVLQELKQKGAIKKIGFSLYYPEEIDFLLEKGFDFDLVQLPYNVFDRRFEDHLNLLQDNGVEVHTRSTFLQGLFFKDPNDLPKKLVAASDRIRQLQALSTRSNIPLAAMLINFVALNEGVDQIVLGVDSLDNLKENLVYANFKESTEAVYEDLLELRTDEEQIILPFNWN